MILSLVVSKGNESRWNYCDDKREIMMVNTLYCIAVCESLIIYLKTIEIKRLKIFEK